MIRHRDQVERRLVNEILIAGHPPHVGRRHEGEGVLGRVVQKRTGWQCGRTRQHDFARRCHASPQFLHRMRRVSTRRTSSSTTGVATTVHRRRRTTDRLPESISGSVRRPSSPSSRLRFRERHIQRGRLARTHLNLRRESFIPWGHDLDPMRADRELDRTLPRLGRLPMFAVDRHVGARRLEVEHQRPVSDRRRHGPRKRRRLIPWKRPRLDETVLRRRGNGRRHGWRLTHGPRWQPFHRRVELERRAGTQVHALAHGATTSTASFSRCRCRPADTTSLYMSRAIGVCKVYSQLAKDLCERRSPQSTARWRSHSHSAALPSMTRIIGILGHQHCSSMALTPTASRLAVARAGSGYSATFSTPSR